MVVFISILVSLSRQLTHLLVLARLLALTLHGMLACMAVHYETIFGLLHGIVESRLIYNQDTMSVFARSARDGRLGH